MKTELQIAGALRVLGIATALTTNLGRHIRAFPEFATTSHKSACVELSSYSATLNNAYLATYSFFNIGV